MEESVTEEGAQPGVFDTYGLVYAYVLLLLVPGVVAMLRLPFRDYTFSYVSLVTLPFVLGIALTFMTDSADSLRDRLLRTAVLVPLVLLTGVGIMFGSALVLVPVSPWIRPQYFGVLTWVAIGLLALAAAPLAFALGRRVAHPRPASRMLEALALAAALLGVIAVVVATARFPGAIGGVARKDATIYVIGAMTWYLPSFGIAAGVWRRAGVI